MQETLKFLVGSIQDLKAVISKNSAASESSLAVEITRSALEVIFGKLANIIEELQDDPDPLKKIISGGITARLNKALEIPVSLKPKKEQAELKQEQSEQPSEGIIKILTDYVNEIQIEDLELVKLLEGMIGSLEQKFASKDFVLLENEIEEKIIPVVGKALVDQGVLKIPYTPVWLVSGVLGSKLAGGIVLVLTKQIILSSTKAVLKDMLGISEDIAGETYTDLIKNTLNIVLKPIKTKLAQEEASVIKSMTIEEAEEKITAIDVKFLKTDNSISKLNEQIEESTRKIKEQIKAVGVYKVDTIIEADLVADVKKTTTAIKEQMASESKKLENLQNKWEALLTHVTEIKNSTNTALIRKKVEEIVEDILKANENAELNLPKNLMERLKKDIQIKTKDISSEIKKDEELVPQNSSWWSFLAKGLKAAVKTLADSSMAGPDALEQQGYFDDNDIIKSEDIKETFVSLEPYLRAKTDEVIGMLKETREANAEILDELKLIDQLSTDFNSQLEEKQKISAEGEDIKSKKAGEVIAEDQLKTLHDIKITFDGLQEKITKYESLCFIIKAFHAVFATSIYRAQKDAVIIKDGLAAFDGVADINNATVGEVVEVRKKLEEISVKDPKAVKTKDVQQILKSLGSRNESMVNKPEVSNVQEDSKSKKVHAHKQKQVKDVAELVENGKSIHRY